ncbi:PREDICTED: probable proline--tRNA ligase, mitochondrial [Papilio polytes]|uniref:probable proline--tRNA ligase, mitochondrial n=1 Tax=Papilio polytes TaxID=76194 RepID=UPI000676B132|nr:PREDICTED: probable proline--tRNA ligase, mitochondrial [Papilio polytes]
MRYLSQIFQPVITIPRDAVIKNTEITCKSQKLLLECGLVRPTSAGFFTLLPLARRVVNKLENLVNQCMEEIGAQRMSLPSLTASKLWEKTGRLQDVGVELLKVEDRHGKKYLLSPTHEEAMADLLADIGPLSYKQLPLLLYQISNKFRDEPRPKHGLLRSREFSMLDAYGAHTTPACASETYDRVTSAYRKLFDILQLPIHRVSAPSGAMGGTLSHEWQLPADAGEDILAVCHKCDSIARAHNESKVCDKCASETQYVNSIEVGHTFVLGARYSAALGAHYTARDSTPTPIFMSCYGIGITRLLAASVEVLANDKALRWPDAIAPYKLLIIGPKEGSKEWSMHGWEEVQTLGQELEAAGLAGEVLLDDKHSHTIGRRMKAADRMGYPMIVVCGRSTTENPPKYELYVSKGVGYTKPVLLARTELITEVARIAGNGNIDVTVKDSKEKHVVEN